MEALGVADGPGGLVVTGAINTPANLGGQTLVPTGGFDMIVAGFDSETAAHLYSVRHGDAGNEFGFLHPGQHHQPLRLRRAGHRWNNYAAVMLRVAP